MKTITAVELRNNMGEIFRRVSAGEEILVTYRDKTKIKLGLSEPKKTRRGEMPGLDALNAASRNGHTFDPDKSIKELYHESLLEKYGKYVK